MKKVKMIGVFVLLLIFVLTFVGCSNDENVDHSGENSSEEVSDNEEVEKLKIGLLLPGTINDQGWNASAYEGIMLIEEELGAEVSYTESVPESDFEEIFRAYANQGCNIIFGHGYQFGDAAKAVAPDFEDVMFIITSTDIYQEPNVCSLENLNIEQGFLSGAFAALMTETGVIGSVGGMEIPSIVAFNEGFEAGAKYVNPEVTALTTYTGDFDDANKVKEMALAMIDNGADIVTHDANQAGLGVFEAAKEGGVLALGCVGDQADIAPEIIITSAANKVSEAMLLGVNMHLNGELEAKNYKFGVAEGIVYLTEYRLFEDEVPDEVKEEINEITEKLANKEIDIEALLD